MGIKTKISYCDSTINPIMGCTGCALRKDHCYAAALCARYAGRKGWPKSFDQPEFFPGRLEKAIKWPDLTGTIRTKDKMWLGGLPRHIFVNDLSDGFCPDVDAWGWLLPHLDAMDESPHVWMLLTKWPDRMQEFFVSVGGAPDNFRLGVSVESQKAADERIPLLLQIPAAARFVSAEPLLGPIDFSPWVGQVWIDCLDGARERRHPQNLDQIIVGGESGPGARPMHPSWVRGIRDQCRDASVPVFVKQMGGHPNKEMLDQQIPPYRVTNEMEKEREELWAAAVTLNGKLRKRNRELAESVLARVGKKAVGRLLDGREWNEMPTLQGRSP